VKKLWELLGGRKFLALLLSFGGLIAGKVASQDWVYIVAIFCSANAIIDIFRGRSNPEKPDK
jgi:hypothetical protein